MSVPSDMNRFSQNPVNLDISRSVFNRNHSVKFSCNVGECIPFLCEEVLPGDTFTIDTSKVVRLQPLVTPIMDEVVLDTYYFFVPNRLIWSHWKEFMGENTQSAWIPQVEYSVPQIEVPLGGWNVGTIADYLGVPINAGAGKKISALPGRAYALVCDQWFRDENNMSPLNIPLDDSDIVGVNTGDQVTDIVKMGLPFIACKMHDYFTSCLPGAQKGQPVGFDFEFSPTISVGIKGVNGGSKVSANTKLSASEWSITPTEDVEANASFFIPAHGYYESSNPSRSLIGDMTAIADGSGSVGFTINELRQAFAIQRYLERSARSGSRYTETIKAFFGVTSPDSRIQRTEYLGGNRVPLNVNQVEQTSATQSGIPTPQGNVVGMSLTGDVNSDFTKSFTEHGYIIGISVARYKHTYQDGIERHWTRKTLFDYYNPVFANLGEQAVKTKEIYFDVVNDDDVFGYQEAWADYRYKPSRVAGEMRSKATTSLDVWHLADDYNSAPSLGDSWIREDKSNLDRCLAVTSSEANQLICDFFIQADVARPMPLYSVPGLIDHH